MPIYEYQCEKCGKRAEYMQSMSEAPKKKCEQPKCGGKLVKLISAAGFVLKGGGWYKDLYSSSKGDSGGESEKASGSAAVPKSDSKSEGKSDSKSEGKSESKSEAKSSETSKSESKPKAEKKPAKKQSSKGR